MNFVLATLTDSQGVLASLLNSWKIARSDGMVRAVTTTSLA